MKKWMLLTRLPMVFVLSLVLPEETTPAESPTIEKAALTRLFTIPIKDISTFSIFRRQRTDRAALPDQPACAYLTVIARDPEGVLRTLQGAPIHKVKNEIETIYGSKVR